MAGQEEVSSDLRRRQTPSDAADDVTFAGRQPVFFDGPATRGLLDEKTGVMWAVDSFAALSPEGVHIELLRPSTVLTAHGPVLTGTAIPDAFDRVRGLAGQPIAPRPGQETMDQMLAQIVLVS